MDNGFEKTRQEFENAYEKARSTMKRPTILTCGYTGSGKTTLAQKICGRDIVPDSAIGSCEPTTQTYVKYDSPLVRFWDSQGFEQGVSEKEFVSMTREFVRRLQDDLDVDNHIHVVWYCIQGPGARATDYDLELIKRIFKNVIVLITKADITRPNQLAGMIGKLEKAGIRRDLVVPVSDTDQESLRDLVQLTHMMLPEAYRDAFLAAQLVDLSKKDAKAHGIIAAHSAAAAGIGAIPIPLSDAPLLMANQAAMIAELALLYGMASEALRMQMMPMLAKAAGIYAASSLSKLIPVLGSVINAVVAASLTFGTGEIARAYLHKCCEARLSGEAIPPFVFDETVFRRAYEQAKSEKPW